MESQAAGFWSYVQQNNVDDNNRILDLSGCLLSSYRLHTDEKLVLFVDRESLEWGAEWNERIEEAIAGTTFFIPIITPSYFKSKACRKELLKFSREAKRLGLEQLVLPIYWITVSELENPDESSDEAVKLIARYQWEDFREIRLEDETSSAFRKAVDRLATELARRTQLTATVEDATQIAIDESQMLSETDDSPGVLDKLARTADTWPKITEILDAMNIEIVRVGQIVEKATERMSATEARGSGIKAKLIQTEKMAHELAGPAQELERLGQLYAAALVDLDPGMQEIFNSVALSNSEDEDRTEFLNEVRSLVEANDYALAGLSEMLDSATEMSKLSRSLRMPLGCIRRGLQGVLDGRAVIGDWGERIGIIDGP